MRNRRAQPTAKRSGDEPNRGTTDLVYGVNAVEEALRAGRRQFESITILETARPDRLKRVLDLARERHVPIHRVP
ncbi:MAG TPA: RNA methyltransferase substrate-binding domain-containing protein [Pyrinomonadaceae bacterium]